MPLVSGPATKPLPRNSESVVASALKLPVKVSLGLRVTTLMTPVAAVRPPSVPLRAFQHFDRLHVVKHAAGARIGRYRHAVDHDCNALREAHRELVRRRGDAA